MNRRQLKKESMKDICYRVANQNARTYRKHSGIKAYYAGTEITDHPFLKLIKKKLKILKK